MSPRFTLRNVASPLLVAGAVWAVPTLVTDALAAPAQTPPPCSPDGVCTPRPETWGWYQTRWRQFPGDRVGAAPTPADDERAAQERDAERQLGGPQLPEPAKEGQIGPESPSNRGGAAPPAEGADPLQAAPPAEQAPPAGQPPAQAPGPAAQPGPGPAQPGSRPAQPSEEPVPDFGAPFGEPPAGNQLDPFGTPSSQAIPPRLPSLDAPVRAAQATQAFEKNPEKQAPPVLDGPNLHGDDAPPALPEALRRYSATPLPAQYAAPLAAQVESLPPVAAAPSAQPTLAPASAPAPRYAPVASANVSAKAPTSIQLVNPAAAAVDRPIDAELEQAIYYEASDQAPAEFRQ